jgi:Regulator of chromosome condensation (RCC1) repeat
LSVAGARHACGSTSDDGPTIVCWGDNSFGQASPPAGPLSYLAAGRNHTCAVKLLGGTPQDSTWGSLVCWGDNSQGS